MCQLLGLSSNMKVDIQLSLLEFRHRGNKNPHGWGFAFYNDGEWEVIKKPRPQSCENVEEETFQFESKIIIGHVRLASCGNKIHQNTHPFKINNWVFAHNGTVSKIINSPKFMLEKYKPEGETDSEYAFCYLLEKIIQEPDNYYKNILKEEVEKIKELGNFNFLLSNGDILIAHGDDRLYYVQRKAPFMEVKYKDSQSSVNLAEIKNPNVKVILVAKEPLTKNEDWNKINGLKIFSDGIEIE